MAESDPYPKPPYPRRSAWRPIGGTTAALLLAGVFIVLVVLLTPILFSHVNEAREPSCRTNLKQQAIAMIMYAQDYDDRLPPSTQWMDVVQPYIKREDVYHCPELAKENPKAYGYAYNSRLANKLTTKISSPAFVLMLCDSNLTQRNASAPGHAALANPPRHGEHTGNNIAYVDGHVKYVGSDVTP